VVEPHDRPQSAHSYAACVKIDGIVPKPDGSRSSLMSRRIPTLAARREAHRSPYADCDRGGGRFHVGFRKRLVSQFQVLGPRLLLRECLFFACVATYVYAYDSRSSHVRCMCRCMLHRPCGVDRTCDVKPERV
jgi:hypothetical protein